MDFINATTICILLLLTGFDLTAQLVSVEELQGMDSIYIKENYKGAIDGTESYYYSYSTLKEMAKEH
ncbi:hypothetical protein [Geofilum rubicundum]|uniref:hypothetical protein n=1 Tax=Geofilum rubicundum TaxID=472113 RepID=UPI000780EB5C|nr:hypothetical protein [Geofilum rubicundum]